MIEVHERNDGLRYHCAIKAEKVTGERATVTFSISAFEVAALQQRGELRQAMPLLDALKVIVARAWELRNSTGDIPFGFGSFSYGAGGSGTTFNFTTDPYDWRGY